MDKQKCSDIVAVILASDGDFPDEVKKHLAVCSECTALANEWQMLRDAELPAVEPVPATLDFAVRQAARRRRWMLPKWFYAVASAACAILFSWLIVSSHQYGNKRHNRDNATNNTAEMVTLFDAGIGLNQFFASIPTESDVKEVIEDIQNVDDGDSYF